MPDINRTFTELLNECKNEFVVFTHCGDTCDALCNSLPDILGVFVISRYSEPLPPMYVGYAGKINCNRQVTKHSIKRRISGSTTPFHIRDNDFKYDPIPNPDKTKSDPIGYNKSIPLKELKVLCLEVRPPKGVPAELRKLLLLGVKKEFGSLPEANRRI